MLGGTLRGEQLDIWQQFVRVTTLLLERLDRELVASAGVSFAELEVLRHLSNAPPEGLRMSDLAAQVSTARGRLTHCVDHLENEGLLQRVRYGNDRQGTFAWLTAKGRALLDRAEPQHEARIHRYVLDQLSPLQLRSMERSIDAILDALEASDTAAGPAGIPAPNAEIPLPPREIDLR